MKIDIEKANAAIDEYIANLRDPKKVPSHYTSLYWTKICLERHGVIQDSRKLDLMDHCVLWVACIVACKRVREVSQIEKEEKAVRPDRSLQKTVRNFRSGKRGFESFSKRFNQHLEDTGVKA